MSVVLHDLRDERRRKREERRQSFREAAKPATPPQEIMRAVATKQATRSSIDFDTLERLDAILTAAEAMVLQWPDDAKRIADGLLLACLRLAWVQVCGKPSSRPEPSRTAMKMFQKGVIDKAVMRRVTHSLSQANCPVHVLDTCRGLLILIAGGDSHAAQ